MPSYRKRPRHCLLPPLAGGGNQSNDNSIDWGRGRISISRQLRANASHAEQKLWQALRRKQINGLRFRRQFPFGPYFADFVCLPARLVIEVDGGQHGEAKQVAHDARRTTWFQRNGFRVLRFWADQVMADLPSVLNGIEIALREPLPRRDGPDASISSPPPARGGGNRSFSLDQTPQFDALVSSGVSFLQSESCVL
jgi:very-short-patch-repair endonuclease